jgi:subtilisin family serine protease
VAGIEMSTSADEAEAATISEEWRQKETVVIPSLGVVVCAASPEQLERLETGGRAPIKLVRPEYEFQLAAPTLPDDAMVSADYLRGYRAGVNDVIADLLRKMGSSSTDEESLDVLEGALFADTAELTWGLQATGVGASRLTGNGIRVAILDTGYEMQHPDFATREIESQSFIGGVISAQDDHGHGTHCLGTLSGPAVPNVGRRYGVAGAAQLFVGKVMKANGKGNEGDILHGIGWAIQNNCRIVSLSFGKAVAPGAAPDADYEQIGAIALRKNCLLIAAAGNDSNRPNVIAPVNLPANSRTVMAVGAVNRRLALYSMSNGGVNADGGGIDLVGPGVEVFSSKRLPLLRGLASGTSMATPHVAGVAALLMEADPSATAEQIWTRLTQSAQRLPLPNSDIGGGLVQIG